MIKKVLLIMMGLALLTSPLFAQTHGMLGDIHPTYRVSSWYIDSDWSLVPGYTGVFDIGTSSLTLANLYADKITINGVEFLGLPSGTDGNWTGATLTTVLDEAPTYFILTHSTGDMFAWQYTLKNSEVFTNATNDTIRAASNSADFAFEIYTPYATDGDATLLLTADASADAGDEMAIVHDGASNSMYFQSDTSSANTLATIMTLAKTGIVTTTNYMDIILDDSTHNAVVDVLNITHSTSGSAAANLGVGLTFNLENDATTVEEHAYIDIVVTNAADNSEESDIVFGLMTAGSLAEVFRVVAASTTTTGDSFTFTSNTTELDAIIDIISLTNVTNTATHNTGLGITWDFEDAGGNEEQASLDVVLIDATDGSEEADFIFSQQSAGGIVETLRLVGLQSATASSHLQFTGTTSQADGIVDIMVLKLDTTDTIANDLGAGISIQIDDAGGVEEQARLDFQVTDKTDAAENCDFILSLNTIGTIREVLKIDTDATATDNTLFTLTSWTIQTNAVQDVLVLVLDNTDDTATDDLGLGISIHIEQEDNSVIEQASIDFTLVDSTAAAEDLDIIFSQVTGGALAETFRLVANSSSTTSDYMLFTANTTETDAIHPVLVLATSTGTAANGHGVSISFRPEDATDSEEQARIDVVQTTAAKSTNDTDFVFTQNVAGALEERVRFDADDDTILLTGTLPKMTIGDGGDEKIVLCFDGNSGDDFYILLDDTSDDLMFGYGSTLATDARITIKNDANDSVVTIGDGQAGYDQILVFDGSAQDYYLGVDDGDDNLNIGVGTAPGTTCAIEINASANVIITTGMTIPYQIHAAAATLTINEGMKLHVFDNASEYELQLPTCSEAAGVFYHIVLNLAPVTTAYTITTGNSHENLFFGVVTVNGAVVGCQTQDLITFTESSAVIGDYVDLYCDGLKWYVSGTAFASTGIVFSTQ